MSTLWESRAAQVIKLAQVPIIVAMKGHKCTGKSTLARELASSMLLHWCDCSLLSYDDVRASIQETLGSSLDDDDLPYQILWQMASRIISVMMTGTSEPRNIVLDSSLPLRSHLDQVLKLREVISDSAKKFSNWEPLFVVVECRPLDELMWRSWLECGGATTTDKPSSWEDLQKEISEYKDYSMDCILHLTVDTTDSSKSVQDHAADVINRISSYYQKLEHDKDDPPNLTSEDTGSCQQASWRHFSHHHSLFSYPNGVAEFNDKEATAICALCRETPSGSVYGCPQCGFYLHKLCAELPSKVEIGETEFLLQPTNKDEIAKSSECVVCYNSSGVLYTEEDYGWKIHQKCTRWPLRLKHSCHQHCLELYIEWRVFTCCACGTNGYVICYFCSECDANFHVMCTLYLEASVKHKCHWHPLNLCIIPRDDTDEYYCEICTGERHANLWAYYCEPCGYEAHLSCVNPEVKPFNPEVLLPDNRGEGRLKTLWRFPEDEELPKLRRNPVLSEISGSQLAWELVDS